MKRLLASLGAITIGVSAGTTSACSFANYKKESIAGSVNDIINISSYFLRSSILSDSANINPNFTTSEYNNRKAKDILPGYEASSATMSKLYQLYFGTDNIGDWYGKMHNVNNSGTAVPIDNSLVDTLNQARMGITLLSKGFTPSTARQISTALSSDTLSQLTPGLINFVTQNIKNHQDTGGGGGAFDYNFFTGLANAFNDSIYLNHTYSDVIKSSIIDLYNFFELFSNDITDPFDANLNYSKTFYSDVIPADTSSWDTWNDVSNEFTNDTKTSIWARVNFNHGNLLTKLLSYYGIPTIIKVLGVMTNFIDQFDSYKDSSLFFDIDDSKKNPSDYVNFFSKTLTNDQVKAGILNSMFNPEPITNTDQSGAINFQNLFRLLDLGLGAHEDAGHNNDYNLLKLVYMLFDNSGKNSQPLNDYSVVVDSLITNKVTFLNKIWGVARTIAVNPLLEGSELDLKSGIFKIILPALKNELVNLLGINIDNFYDKLQSSIIGWKEIYSNKQTIITDLLLALVEDFKKGGKDYSILEKIIKYLPNIETAQTEKIGDLLSVFGFDLKNNSVLYFLYDNSLTSLLDTVASWVDVDNKINKNLYQSVKDMLGQKKYIIKLQPLSKLMNACGVKMNDTLAKNTTYVHAMDWNGGGISPFDPATTPTIDYAMYQLKYKNLKNGGTQGFMATLGYYQDTNTHQESYWDNDTDNIYSVFGSMQHAYNDGTDGIIGNSGVNRLLVIANKVFDMISDGMNNNYDHNYATYYQNSDFQAVNRKDWYENRPDGSYHFISYEYKYSAVDPNTKKTITNIYEVTLDSVDSQHTGAYLNWSLFDMTKK